MESTRPDEQWSLRAEAANRARQFRVSDGMDSLHNNVVSNHDGLYETPFPPSHQSHLNQHYQSQSQPQLPVQPYQHFSNTVPAVATSNSSTNSNLANQARQEWQQHGTSATQALQEKRRAQRPGDLQVEIIQAVSRTDLVGKSYTAYVIRVQQGLGNNSAHSNTCISTAEHRYSDFDKLRRRLMPYGLQEVVTVPFPPKQTPFSSNPFKRNHAASKQRDQAHTDNRQRALDAWLVHVVYAMNRGDWAPSSSQQQPVHWIREFLLAAPVPPCDQLPVQQYGNQDNSNWNNPWSTTLGSALRQATRTLYSMTNPSATRSTADQSIPLDLLQAAQGLLFLTVFKAGLVVSGRIGTGLVIARLPGDGNQGWSAPCAMGTAGLGWGAQIGTDVTHYLLVLTSREQVHDLVNNPSTQLGAEFEVAIGPTGRGAQTALQTNGRWKNDAENRGTNSGSLRLNTHTTYAYAHAQGFFIGVSLEGSVVQVRPDVNAVFYGTRCDALDLLQQAGPVAAQDLYRVLDEAQGREIPNGFRPTVWWQQRQERLEQQRQQHQDQEEVTANAQASWKNPPIAGLVE